MIYCLFITSTTNETLNKVKPTIEQVLTDNHYDKQFVEINEAFPQIKANRMIKTQIVDIIAEDIRNFIVTDGITYTFGFFPIYPPETNETPNMRVNTLYYRLNW